MTENTARSTAKSVGVVGLGAMGRPVAERLAAAGRETLCFDTDTAAMDRAAAKGVHPVASLAELGGRADVVLVMVPTDEDVLVVCSPETGLLAAPRRGAVLVISSSVRPQTCHHVAAPAAERGVAVLDAALTGGVRAAEAGQVTLLVGGDAEVLDGIAGALEPWTKTWHVLGGLGAGQVGKTVNNLCHWGQLSVIIEALRLGGALGVAPAKLREALLDGPVASRTLADMQLMRLTWPAKDLANAFALADAVGQPLPVAATVREAMRHTTVADITDLYAAT